MILSKSDSRYSAVSPSVAAMAFIRSTSKPMILPLSSLNSLGGVRRFTPTTSLPLDLMFSGTVVGDVVDLSAATAVVEVVGPGIGVLRAPRQGQGPDCSEHHRERHTFPRLS